MSAPSSQGPCICPEGAVKHDCPRCAFMWDWVGQNPFKDHLRRYCNWCGGAFPGPHECGRNR